MQDQLQDVGKAGLARKKFCFHFFSPENGEGAGRKLSIPIAICKSRETDRRICRKERSDVDSNVKIIGLFGVVATASIALLQPAQGGSRGGGRHSFSPAYHYSTSAGHFSGRPHFSGDTARYYRSSPRFSSPEARRDRTYSSSRPRLTVDRASALRPRTFSASRPGVATNRRAALRPQVVNNRNRVQAQFTRNWDRHRDHFWRGHRCRWYHNSWVLIDPWLFYPWGYGYGYYPYGAYSYYDDAAYYDDGDAVSEYSPSEYDNGYADSSVSDVQTALARKGYYRGGIDGSLGPETREALRRYQRNQGLAVTGRIDRRVIERLGLQ